MTKSEITSTTPSTPTTATTTTTNVSASSATATTTPTASTNTNAIISTNSASTGVKTLPRDSSIIVSILKDMGIVEYEPRVVHQLLEFTYRYVTTVLEDAQVFSQYANKKVINADDVKLAIQLQVEKMFTSPPPRDSLMEIARQKNNQPLPPIKSHAGPRLPPDRYSLIACNYRLKSSAKLKGQQQLQLQQQQSLASSSSGIGSLGSKITLPFRTLQSGTAATILTQLGNRNSSNVILPVRTPTTVSSVNPINNNASNSLTLPTVTEIKSVNQIEKEGESGIKRKLDDDEDA